MAKLYLLRHGEPALPQDGHICLGALDLPLSRQGVRQAERLHDYFRNRDALVCASDLQRSVDTAAILAGSRQLVRVCPDFREMAMGEWEGLSFSEIRQQYPQLYAERERDPFLAPPGGETGQQALTRFSNALHRIIWAASRDVVVVAHRSVNLLYLASLAGSPAQAFALPQPYGCINELEIGNGVIALTHIGLMPDSAPSPEECLRLLEKYHTPDPVIGHGQCVAAQAETLAEKLAEAGVSLDIPLIRAAALLHDIARSQPHHAETGAQWVCQAGYLQAANIIRQHHELVSFAAGQIDEAAVVFLADKYIQGTDTVSLARRFAESRHKCPDTSALIAHQRRWEQAKEVERLIFSYINQGEAR